jgi:hypothetical protein
MRILVSRGASPPYGRVPQHVPHAALSHLEQQPIEIGRRARRHQHEDSVKPVAFLDILDLIERIEHGERAAPIAPNTLFVTLAAEVEDEQVDVLA